MQTRLLRFLLGAATIACCAAEPLSVGGLYATRQEDGTYLVLKVLATDDGGVHLRLYSNRYAQRPTTIVESELYMAGVDHKPGESIGMGHLPVSWRSFRGWRATFVQQAAVAEDEREGYKMWQEAEGGYF